MTGKLLSIQWISCDSFPNNYLVHYTSHLFAPNCRGDVKQHAHNPRERPGDQPGRDRHICLGRGDLRIRPRGSRFAFLLLLLFLPAADQCLVVAGHCRELPVTSGISRERSTFRETHCDCDDNKLISHYCDTNERRTETCVPRRPPPHTAHAKSRWNSLECVVLVCRVGHLVVGRGWVDFDAHPAAMQFLSCREESGEH